jgi:hypothetical protein
MNRPRWAVAAAVGLIALGAGACSKPSTPLTGRLVVDGEAEVIRPGEDRRIVDGSRTLKAADRIRVRKGTAVIRLPDGRQVELREGTDVEMKSSDGGETARPALLGGDLLVTSGGQPLAVELNGAEVAVQGDARVSRGMAVLVAVYKGTAQLSARGSTLTVPALRQAALPATEQFPARPTPLEVLPSDGWDQRFLSDAIELGTQLSARSQGFSAQLTATEGRTVNYFRDLFPRLAAEPAFTAALINPNRAPGETLVGAAITLEGWANVFGFRDVGAPWGLVALDQEVSRVPILAAIDGAISRGPTLFAEGPVGRTPSSIGRPNTGSPATTSVPTTTATTVRPRPGATTSTTAPAAPTTTTTVVGPLNTGAPVLDNTVNNLVNTLTGLLKSLGGG